MDRRSFIKTIGAVGAAAGMSGCAGIGAAGARSAGRCKRAVLKLSSQEWRVAGKTMQERFAKLDKYGAAGVEIKGEDLYKNMKTVKESLKPTNLKVSAICAGYTGVFISSDAGDRENAVATTKELLVAAGELGAVGVILVPAFRDGFLKPPHPMGSNSPNLRGEDARKVLIDELRVLGDFALKCDTLVILEPLNRKEAYFLRQLADAASICRDADSEGAMMMGDFYHMNFEETSDMGAFLSGGRYVRHVHLASTKRNLPGQDERSFVDGFRGLKMIGFQGYCSLECEPKGDPDIEIPKSFRFLEKQWEQATI